MYELYDSRKFPVGVVPSNASGVRVTRPVSPESSPAPYYPSAGFGDTADTSDLVEYWRILFRNRAILLLASGIGAILGLFATLPQTPMYRATTTVEIQPPNQDFMNQRQVDPTQASYGADTFLETQAALLSSRSLVTRVIDELDLATAQSPLLADEWALPWFGAKREDDGAPPDMSRLSTAAMTALNVKSRPGTQIVEVSFESSDSMFAAQFVNKLADEFIEQSIESRWQQSQRTGDWLSRQMEQVKARLEKSEDDLQQYARSAGLVITRDDASVDEDKLRGLQKELLDASAERVKLQSRYELAQSAPVESLGDALDDEGLRGYQTKLADLKRQLAELRTLFSDKYHKVRQAEAQIQEMQQSAETLRANILRRVRNDFETAQRREELLRNDYANQSSLVTQLSEKGIRYSILRREVDTNRQIYDSMLQRVKESGIAAALRASNIRVVDLAYPPTSPYRPRKTVNAAIGLIGGLFMGVAFVFLRERSDRTFRQPGEAPVVLGVQELGTIPNAQVSSPRAIAAVKVKVRANLSKSPRLLKAAAGVVAQPAVDGSDGREKLELVTYWKPQSVMSESFRSTVTSLLVWESLGELPRVVAVTSPDPGDGKTTVCTNLATAFAIAGKRVLLVDGDLRRPRIHDIFRIPNVAGLGTLLGSREPDWETIDKMECIYQSEVPGLHVMPAGALRGDITTLLFSSRCGELIAMLRGNYDMVLIDCPPMLHLADARILGLVAEGVVVVLRSGKTTRDEASVTIERLRRDGIQVLGTILNDWNPRHSRTSNYSHSDYYRKYYSYNRPGGSTPETNVGA